MEIRFCDRCSESIPEVDFDAGKAVTVGGRHYHAACALTKSLSLGGPRSWLTFLLALFGAAVGAWALVSHFSREEPPAVTADVQDAIRAEVAASERALADRVDEAYQRGLEASSTETSKLVASLRDDLAERLERLEGRLQEGERTTAEHVTSQRRRLQEVEKELAALGALLRDVREQADRLEAQRVASAPTPPIRPEPQPEPQPETQPQPEPVEPPPVDDVQDEEVERWIRRLTDPNENIRFTATLQLGLLKSLKATQPLVHALEKDRDYYVRLGAATALGDIQAVDAVPALIEALEDDDALVRTAANDALQAITEQPFEFVPGMSRSERRKLQRRWGDWYGENENALRQRLGQPKTP